MSKKFLCFVTIILIFIRTQAFADEYYYTNNYGMKFTEFQYNAMVEKLSEDIVADMTYQEYQHYNVSLITEDNYYSSSYDDTNQNNSRATYYETTCKKTTISAGCNSNYCLIDLTTTWKCIPAVKSYDVIGFRLSNTSYTVDYGSMYAKLNGEIEPYDGRKGASNGIGWAIKIPSSGDIEYATSSIQVQPQGIVYGSYQHAIENISLNTALDFTFNSSGYGGVFAWPSSYGQIFDQMAGVYINLTNL